MILEFDAAESGMQRLVREGKLNDIYRQQYFERSGIPMDPRTTEGGNWVSDLLP